MLHGLIEKSSCMFVISLLPFGSSAMLEYGAVAYRFPESSYVQNVKP